MTVPVTGKLKNMQLIDLKLLSKRTCMSVSSLRKLIRDGMPHYRVARKILIDTDEFTDWFQRFKWQEDTAPQDLDGLLDEVLDGLDIQPP